MHKGDAMDNEENIIKSILSGNINDFEIIVNAYQKFVYAICRSIIKDPHEAENVAQEVFIQVYNSLENYEFKGFKTWIGKIATNKSIDYKRKAAKNVIYIDDVHTLESAIDSSPSEAMEKEEEIERLKILCKELPLIYGSVINKYYIENKSYHEIAFEEGLSVKTVESRLYRAKAILKGRWIEDEYR